LICRYTEVISKFGVLAKLAPRFFDRRSRACVKHMVDTGDQKAIDESMALKRGCRGSQKPNFEITSV
jgi:hypothetical protein